MKDHYDFFQSIRNPYTGPPDLEELSRVLADYRSRAPMSLDEFEKWWVTLSPSVQLVIDKCVPIIMALRRTEDVGNAN